MKENVTYMLRCADGTFYTGWTNDLPARIASHNAGHGAKYTRSRLPVELIYFERFETASEARSREFRLKRLSRKEKEDLLQNPPANALTDASILQRFNAGERPA